VNANQDIRQNRHLKRNFIFLALYQVVLRVGWVFKTESIIIPAVLDSLGGPAWLRGMLPMLNRIGQSIPPLLLADRVNAMPVKKWALVIYTIGMSIAFAVLSLLWWTGRHSQSYAPGVFLSVYCFFFCCLGIVNMTFGTLQGKLVPVSVRGRLIVVANSIGAIVAIAFAWWLMDGWLSANGEKFSYVFAFTAASFSIAAVIAMLVHEHRDDNPRSATHEKSVAACWRVLRQDIPYRRALCIAFLFGSSMTIFPHYQALARERLGLSFGSMTAWVIIQNIGTGVFGILFGFLADKKGNRAVLRIAMFGVAGIPIMALALSNAGEIGKRYFWTVFVLFSLTPVTIKMLNNFALEFTEPESHPRYLSLMALSIAFPIYFSPVFGVVIDRFGFDIPMLFVSGCVAIGWVLTMFVSEPRESLFEDGVS
jgi:Na+-transporting methylmalonyl-CoA/oxaloacetate decarboxylase gamma subunit